MIDAARDHGIPIRIGVNAGSLEKDLQSKYGEPTADALVYAAIVAVTAVALGALLECLSWARWLELLRLLGVGVAFALLPDWFGFQAPVALRGAVLVFAIGSAAWLLRRSTTAQQVPA